MPNFDLSALDGINVAFAAPSHPIGSSPRATLWHIISHYTPGSAINETMYISPSPEEPGDEALAVRIMDAFYKAAEHEKSQLAPTSVPNEGVWEAMKHGFHGEIYDLLASRNARGLAEYLRNAARQPITHGLGPGRQVFEAMAQPGEGQNANVLLLLDRLSSLAEAVGALPQENPEQGRYGQSMSMSAKDICDRIEIASGLKVGRKPVMGNFGIIVGERVVDVRVPDDVYSAFRLSKIISKPINATHVCEIGAGLGGVAYEAISAGIGRYSIVDLPVILTIQAWFLSKLLGQHNLRLFGEDDSGQRVQLSPYWDFYNENEKFDIVFNRDSMPEIPITHVRDYLEEIARRKVPFLSINQEAQAEAGAQGALQLWIHDLVLQQGSMRCTNRHRHWTREGYVEELFTPLDAAATRSFWPRLRTLTRSWRLQHRQSD